MSWIAVVICVLWGVMVSLLVIPALLVPPAGSTSWRMRLHQRSRELHHTQVGRVSRLGGCALGLCFVVVAALAWFVRADVHDLSIPRWGLIISSLAMLGLGLIDDVQPMGARRKLVGQVLVSLLAWALGIRFETLPNPFGTEAITLGLWGLPLTIVWLVGMANLINLVDGIDGLAAGVSLMLMVVLAWSAVGTGLSFTVALAAGMVGSLVGFLGYNFPPAKIYLGDGGAYFLGFLAGSLSLVNSQKGIVIAALAAPLFVLGLPILDTSLAIIRRGLKGLPVFRADRGHIHHLMLSEGFTRRTTVLILYAICLIFLLLGLGVMWTGIEMVPVFIGLLFVVLLVLARSFSFSRYWFSVGKVLSNSAEVRRHMPRVVSLCTWLEHEADWADSLDALWEPYRFGAEQLGLCGLTICLAEGQRQWESDPGDSSNPIQRVRVNVNSDGVQFMEFAALQGSLSQQPFRFTCEMLAESWLRVTKKWSKGRGKPVRFDR